MDSGLQIKMMDSIRQLLRDLRIGQGRIGYLNDLSLPDVEAYLAENGYKASPLTLNEGVVTPCAAYLVCNLARRKDGDVNMATMKSLCERDGAPLIVVTLNCTHKDVAFRLLCGRVSGGTFDPTHPGYAIYDEHMMDSFMQRNGFICIDNADVQIEATQTPDPEFDFLLQKQMLAHQYLLWISQQANPAAQTYAFIRAYTPAAYLPETKSTGKEKRPFLSVITRTQGTRIPELRSVLESLAKQACDDFELLIVGHKVEIEAEENVFRLIEETEPNLRERIRYLQVDVGRRGVPINTGLLAARGEYLSILDDDDLVYEDWVSAFKEASQKASGTVLQAYCETQKWKKNPDSGVLEPTSETIPEYCEPFDYVKQLTENRCPTLSLAFPVGVMSGLRYRFSETLDTMEDWECLMYLAYVAGVTSIEKVTSVYRQWENGHTSAQLHNKAVWAANFDSVKAAIHSRPVLLPPGGTRDIDRYYHEILLLKDQLEKTRAELARTIEEYHETQHELHLTKARSLTGRLRRLFRR